MIYKKEKFSVSDYTFVTASVVTGDVEEGGKGEMIGDEGKRRRADLSSCSFYRIVFRQSVTHTTM